MMHTVTERGSITVTLLAAVTLLTSVAAAVKVGDLVPLLGGALVIIVASFVGYVQLRSAGETRARELWQQEAEALRARLKSMEEDLAAAKGKMAHMQTTIDVLSTQVTNTHTITEVEKRLTQQIETATNHVQAAIDRTQGLSAAEVEVVVTKVADRVLPVAAAAAKPKPRPRKKASE